MPINLPKIKFQPGMLTWDLCRWLEKLQYEVNRLDNVRSAPGVHEMDSGQGMHFWVEEDWKTAPVVYPVRLAATSPTFTGWTSTGPKKEAPTAGRKSSDGFEWDDGDTLIFPFEANPVDNGIYIVIKKGDVGTKAEVQRSPITISPGMTFPIFDGTTNKCTIFKNHTYTTSPHIIDVGTDAQYYKPAAPTPPYADAATIIPLSPGYTQGTDGTLTGSGALPTIDSVAPPIGSYILVKNEVGDGTYGPLNRLYMPTTIAGAYVLKPWGPYQYGMQIPVRQGPNNGNKTLQLSKPADNSGTYNEKTQAYWDEVYGYSGGRIAKGAPTSIGTKKVIELPVSESSFGSTILDAISGTIATIVGGVTRSTDVPSAIKDERAASMLFNGTTGYLTFGTSAVMSLLTGVTIACWIKLTSLPTTDTATIYSENWASGVVWAFEATSGGVLLFSIYNGGSFKRATSGTPMKLQTWYHVACTLSSSEGMEVYNNGKTDGSNANTSPYDSSLGAITSVRVGGKIDGVNLGRFTGSIADFRAYGVALTDFEINQLANGDTGHNAKYQVAMKQQVMQDSR